MKLKKVILSISFVILLVVTLLYLCEFKNNNKLSFAEQVIENYNDLDTYTHTIYEIDPMRAMSSNPYDYTDNNPYYDNLVSMGIQAVPLLEQFLSYDDDSLTGYLTALAISEITSSDVYEAKGVSWENSSEFAEAWNDFTSNAVIEVKEILDSTDSTSNKISQMRAYGVLAVPAIDDYCTGVNRKKSNEFIELKSYKKTFELTKEEENIIKNITAN